MSKARLVVFPIKGRKWCFSRSIDHFTSDSNSTNTPSTFKDLWNKISSSSSSSTENPTTSSNVQLLVDFVSNKMNRAWTGLEKAPAGSLKNKIHGLGLRLLSRVKPSEIFLKSITNEVTSVEVLYPPSLNERFVRRRLRHIALRGTVIHKKYFYGSVSLLPLTTAFTVLPLPNIPFFWTLFRTYSHWRALKGSEKLLQLVSDCSENLNGTMNGKKTAEDNSDKRNHNSLGRPWVLQPSKELEELLKCRDEDDGRTISDICKTFNLNSTDVLKYRHSL